MIDEDEEVNIQGLLSKLGYKDYIIISIIILFIIYAWLVHNDINACNDYYQAILRNLTRPIWA